MEIFNAVVNNPFGHVLKYEIDKNDRAVTWGTDSKIKLLQVKSKSGYFIKSDRDEIDHIWS